MDIQSLPTRFRLPLPKPINGSFSSFKYNESPINNSAPTNPQSSQTSSLDIIPCRKLFLFIIQTSGKVKGYSVTQLRNAKQKQKTLIYIFIINFNVVFCFSYVYRTNSKFASYR